MRLTDSIAAVSLPRSEFGQRAFGDMRRLFGGITLSTEGFDGKFRQFVSHDDLVRAFEIRRTLLDEKTHTTGVRIEGLEDPQGPSHRRWTALQAYRARAGVPCDILQLETPGLAGYNEWVGRYRKRITEARPAALSSEEIAFFAKTSEGSGNDPASRYARRASNLLVEGYFSVVRWAGALEGGDRADIKVWSDQLVSIHYESDEFQRSELPEEWPHAYTVFTAKGFSLPEAARTMADGYAELCFHSQDAEIAVAKALGTTSLDRLEMTWDEAMKKRSPLKSAQCMLSALTPADR